MANYWIFQANPKTRFILHYYLKDYVQKNLSRVDWWDIGNSNVREGDIVFLWKAKGEPTKKDATEYYQWLEANPNTEKGSGIFAMGKVVKVVNVAWWKGTPDEVFLRYFVLHERGKTISGRCAYFQYDILLVDRPLLEAELWADRWSDGGWCVPGLEPLKKKMRYAAMTVYKVEPDQGHAIKKLIDGIEEQYIFKAPFQRTRRVSTRGGESEAHKAVKEYTKTNADKLFGPGSQLFDEEYDFDTGDRADLVFRLPNNEYVAVEVEVDIYPDVIPGLLQAIKYRWMLPVQLRIPNERVRGALVARSIDKSVKDLCDRYEIKWHEVP